jgi:anti-anti-sigma factor
MKLETLGNTVVATPAGRIDVGNAGQIQAALWGALDDGAKQLLLDLSDVSYVSSVGLAVCLKCGKRADQAGGGLALCSLNEHVAEVFDVSGFGKLFGIYPSRGEALAALGVVG